MTETFLYLYRNDELRQVYVGIGTSPGRIWGGHNPAATALLEHNSTTVFITGEPFPDRKSAERAESAAICAAAAAGVEVLSDRDDLESLTNIAKVGSSTHLRRAVFRQEGTVRYDELERAAIVTLHPNSIDDVGDGARRPALHGGRSEEVFHYRATRWWGLGQADKRRSRKKSVDGELPRDVDRLIAIQKGTHTVLGAWTLTEEQWRRDGCSWMFLTDEAIPEWRGQQFDWCGAHPSNAVTWSPDIRAGI